MRTRQIIGAVAAIVVLCLALYQLSAHRPLSEPRLPAAAPPPASLSAGPASPPEPVAVENVTAALSATSPLPDSRPLSAGRKLIEIHGRIVDRDGRPLVSAVVAEERYFHSTRSDARGRYKLLMEMPRHRYPVLHFLRAGYAPARISLGRRELDSSPIYRLDVALDDAPDAVALEGRVANEIGVGLEGARVQLTASYARNQESFYLTEFTDSRGRFRFESVLAGQAYKLAVNLTPQYPYYENADYFVAQNPAPVDVVLQTLEFVDVEGMILTRDAVPVPGYEIYITNLGTGIHSRKIVSDSSGYFRLENFPLGAVDLATRGSEFYRIAGLELRRDNYQNLILTVDRGNHHLSGWVSDASGMALEKAMVTVDRKFDENGLLHTSYRSQGTDIDGAFAFAELGGGEHHVTAYAWGYEKQELRLNFDRPARALHFRLEASR